MKTWITRVTLLLICSLTSVPSLASICDNIPVIINNNSDSKLKVIHKETFKSSTLRYISENDTIKAHSPIVLRVYSGRGTDGAAGATITLAPEDHPEQVITLRYHFFRKDPFSRICETKYSSHQSVINNSGLFVIASFMSNEEVSSIDPLHFTITNPFYKYG